MRGSSPFYRVLFAQAWRLTWNHKKLWVLGLFSAFWGVSGVQLFMSWLGTFLRDGSVFAAVPRLRYGVFHWSSLPALISLLAVSAFLLWLVTASRAGLLWGVREQTRGRLPGIRDMLTAGTRVFWPVFGVSLIGRWVMGGLFLMFAFYVVHPTRGASLMSFVATSVLLSIIGMVVSFLTVYATLGVVIRGDRFLESWSHAWKLFRNHWVVTVEMALMLYVLNMLMALTMIIATAVVMMPVMLLLVILSFINAGTGILMIVFFPVLVVASLALIVISAGFTTFQFVCWTLLFLKVEERAVVPKLARLVGALRRRMGFAT